MGIEKEIRQYLEDNKISIEKLSKKTNIKYMNLYHSLRCKQRKRPLKAEEFMRICEQLNIKAERFYKN